MAERTAEAGLTGEVWSLNGIQLQVGPDGNAHVAFANNASPDGVQRIWYAGQISGRRAGNGLQDTNWCARSGG